MTFIIVKNPKAWWPVIVPGVTDDGKVVQNKFEMRFRILDEDETIEISKLLTAEVEADGGVTPSVARTVTVSGIMKLAEDWRGVEQAGEKGAATSVPFNQENVAMLCNLPNVTDAILRAYRACRAAEPETRRGN